MCNMRHLDEASKDAPFWKTALENLYYRLSNPIKLIN
jgi:hypothetical protein